MKNGWIRKYLERTADKMNERSEKGESTVTTIFWNLIAEKIELSFTEKVEEQVKWDDGWF